MSPEELKKEARGEAKSKFNFNAVFGENSRAEQETLTFLDTLIDKAFTAGKEAGLEEGFDNGYEAATGEVIVRSNTSS